MTEDEVTEVIKSADGVTSVEAVADAAPQNAAQPAGALVNDPVVRSTIERGLYKSRGFASLLKGGTASDPNVRAGIEDWFRQFMNEHNVTVVTPQGPVDHETMVALMGSDAAHPASAPTPGR